MVDLGPQVAAICQQLGLEPRNVRQLTMRAATTPPHRSNTVTAEIYKLRDGEKYIGDDGEPALTIETYDVRFTI